MVDIILGRYVARTSVYGLEALDRTHVPTQYLIKKVIDKVRALPSVETMDNPGLLGLQAI
jgi:hypothetical protein